MAHVLSIRLTFVWLSCLSAVMAGAAAPADEDVLMRALVDEMGRSMSLQLEDLPAPYFVQYSVDDRHTHVIAGSCGAIVASDDGRSRRLSADVRVGDYDLDSTNFAGGGGGFGGRRRGGGGGFGAIASLPLEDSYMAVRQAAWLAADSAYKSAVETLARKQAYMEDRNLQDRPADFTRVEPIVSIDPTVALTLDAEAWERRLKTLSARFLDYPQVLDSQITLAASADNRYLVNSEGTRLRRGVVGAVLTVSAQAQAADGEQLSDRITHHAAVAEGLPGEADLLAEIDAMARCLTGRVEADVLESYLGPVLFDGQAAPQLFQTMLAQGVAGTPEPVGGGRRRFAGLESLDKYLGKRILPRDFRIYDDPTEAWLGESYLAGHYAVDDEGVQAQRVEIVVDGRLNGMVMSRVPTSDFTGSNGHGRSAGLGRTQAAIGCLFIESADALSEAELKEALIEAIEDQGLEYGLRITSIGGAGGARRAMMRSGRQFPRGGGGPAAGGSMLGDPINIYKVYPDGREELVRGCEFGSVDVGTLRDILAAGREPIIYNTGSATGAASIIAPAVLFEEMELFTIEAEHQTLPIVDAPHQRRSAR